MSLLRIRISLKDPPLRCRWALIGEGREAVLGEGLLSDLPRHAGRVQLVIPAAQVLIVRVLLPPAARRDAGSVLAYAVEDRTAADPDTLRVSRLGSAGESDVLAVVDRAELKHWLDAFEAAGIGDPEVHCETLLLPWSAGEWSLVWDGREGIVRTGLFEGAATDQGDRMRPPLVVRLLLDEARSRGERPASIALYAATAAVAPDLDAWQRELGIALRAAGPWSWQDASPQNGISLVSRRRWRMPAGILGRLRPAAWLAAAALAIHLTAALVDWSLLAGEQRKLRESMVARFRATVPEAVTVVDPVLQMQRKLATARHAAGLSDDGDFLPMVAQVMGAAKELPAGSLRALSYEQGRMTLELSGMDEAGLRHIVARLAESGLRVDEVPAAAKAESATMVLTVWST